MNLQLALDVEPRIVPRPCEATSLPKLYDRLTIGSFERSDLHLVSSLANLVARQRSCSSGSTSAMSGECASARRILPIPTTQEAS